MFESGRKKISSQIEKPDDLQSIANHPAFFAYAGQSPSMMEITQKSLAVNLTESLACRLSRRCICQNHCRLRTHQ
ncbi:MAG: hypothetical protein EGQ92_08715 [Lactobacillus ruminis]|nr:hypothetical protein [Ligilactobacillus ruminis]